MITIIMAIALYIIDTLLYKTILTDKPNYFAGYRTPRSLQSERHWQLAQEYSTKLIQKLCPILLIIGIIQLLIEITIGYEEQSSIASVILLLITVIIVYVKTENRLKKL
ncbi:hypothetical protein BFS35_007490 [Macrococcoides goetzii]|uniref:SdpI family protein n=1 Tax=Macrococcoides goetzii TaxID=1891097 RepID=A0A395GBL7_9STAP|nr:SdpI family protein [Macrococcus goetzii]RAI81406.1 hypothetical protein BFS35_007490 [Macrococcus goetzii]